MRTAFILLLAVVAASAAAAESVQSTFGDRVSMAKAAEEDESFHTYPSQMVKKAGRDLARTMRRCWPPLGTKQDIKPFILVADIDAYGWPRNVEVKPRHAASRCFATGFSSIHYLPAPPYPGREGFPVTMRIAGGR